MVIFSESSMIKRQLQVNGVCVFAHTCRCAMWQKKTTAGHGIIYDLKMDISYPLSPSTQSLLSTQSLHSVPPSLLSINDMTHFPCCWSVASDLG